MRFWDTSALVAACVSEPFSAAVQELLLQDSAVAVWWCTPVECASAITRRRRGGDLTLSGEGNAVAVLGQMKETWTIVDAIPSLRDRAIRLVRVHGLRAADGLQLAAALAWAENHPPGHEFVCLDRRLREAAAREGFVVVPDEVVG